MSKNKTHKGMAKRVTVTKGGKVKRKGSGARHLKSKKSGKQIRQLRGTSVVTGAKARRIKVGLA